MPNSIVTRFPPSPTGNLHVGSARTALFNYLFAKKMGGIMHLRIEDTDKERSKKEFETNIIEGLSWLGISYDSMERQSERGDLYATHISKLLQDGAAFISDDEGGKGKVIRFKNPGGIVSFNDMVRGEISFDVTELGDFVIARNEREPLYHLAVVIDDSDQGVTHIIRGEDGISNTPRQILLQRAIGAALPTYVHIPLILAPDKSKLSKRYGSVSLTEYRDQGYLPEAMINYLALLGWSPQGSGDREIFSLDELIERFDLAQIHKSGAVFNIEKLKWINREYIKLLGPQHVADMVKKMLPHRDAEMLKKILPHILERVNTLSDIKNLDSAGELEYFFTKPEPSLTLLRDQTHLGHLIELLREIPPTDWEMERIKDSIWGFATEVGRAAVLWPLRVALTGLEKSPDPFTVAALLGKDETLARVEYAQTLR